jgi:hypothetical protein
MDKKVFFNVKKNRRGGDTEARWERKMKKGKEKTQLSLRFIS